MHFGRFAAPHISCLNSFYDSMILNKSDWWTGTSLLLAASAQQIHSCGELWARY